MTCFRENFDSYRGEYEGFIDYGPDLFRLLVDILNDRNIGPHIRVKINAASSLLCSTI